MQKSPNLVSRGWGFSVLSGIFRSIHERIATVFRSRPSRTPYLDLGDRCHIHRCARRTHDRPATPGPTTASGVLSGCGSCRPFQHTRSRGGRSSGTYLRTLVRLSSGPPGSLGQMVGRTGCTEVNPEERRALSVAVCCNTHGFFLGLVGLLGAGAIIRHPATRLQSWVGVLGS